MAVKFNMTRDINGYNGFGLPPSDTIFSVTLTVSTDTTVTVPGGTGLGGYGISSSAVWIAIFSFDPGTSVWVAFNHTAAAPAGATLASTTSELNPAARQVKSGDVIHLFSTGTGVNASINFYSIS